MPDPSLTTRGLFSLFGQFSYDPGCESVLGNNAWQQPGPTQPGRQLHRACGSCGSFGEALAWAGTQLSRMGSVPLPDHRPPSTPGAPLWWSCSLFENLLAWSLGCLCFLRGAGREGTRSQTACGCSVWKGCDSPRLL